MYFHKACILKIIEPHWLEMLSATQSSFYNNTDALMTFKKLPISTLVSDTYRSSSFLIVDLQVGHSFDDGHNGLDCVAVDNGSVLLALIF